MANFVIVVMCHGGFQRVLEEFIPLVDERKKCPISRIFLA